MFSTAAFRSCGELHEDDEGPDGVVEDPEKVHLVRLPAAVGDIETGWPAGWPDWAIFHQLGYFWRFIVIFWKDEVAQRNGDILGYFLL